MSSLNSNQITEYLKVKRLLLSKKTDINTVLNGPAIAVEGISENEVVDGVLPIMINAYGKGDQKRFLIEGSETPQSIPAWLWALIIGFVGWGIYYAVTALNTLL